MRRSLVLMASAAAMLAASPQIAAADPKHCPPGHAKKGWCAPGPRYDRAYRTDRRDHDYVVIRDYDRYGLRPPRDGYYYGVRDDEVYLISRATQDIIEAIGAVSYLLSR